MHGLISNDMQFHRIFCMISQLSIARINFSSCSFRFNIDLQTLAIFGKQTDTQIRPVLATGDAISTHPVIHVELELAPLDKKSDYRLFLRIEPLKIVYDAVGDQVQASWFFDKEVYFSGNNQSNCAMFWSQWWSTGINTTQVCLDRFVNSMFDFALAG